MDAKTLKAWVEAILLAADQPLKIEQMLALYDDNACPSKEALQQALQTLTEECNQEGRGVELKALASGYQFRSKPQFAPWIAKLWEEKPPRYSRALLETLALIAYRQPITRAEIEDVRGVVVSSHIMRTLLERQWVKIVGQKDVPGKPNLYATTKQFLDYFNLKKLKDLPSLPEAVDLEQSEQKLAEQLELTVVAEVED